MNDFLYKVNDIEYPVHITYKRIKNIHYRFRDGAFYVSCNRLVSKKTIKDGIEKYGPGLIKRVERLNINPQGEDFIYFYGVKVNLEESGEIPFSDGSKIVYKNKEDLEKKLKKHFLDYVTKLTNYYTSLMKLPTYKVRIRDMKSRYGSNSKQTKTIRYSTVLMHYSHDIIESVVVHEVSHIVVYDHSKAFWNVVYKYCPNYDVCRKKLIRGEFS
ncbi:MAG: M48 family metallopeptidase [Bacilli bacterium]|nr:M48 family metallopeptidase [Bacilli bacterium]